MKTGALRAVLITTLAGSAAGAYAQSAFPEVEPNESKTQATLVTGMVAGDTIAGNTTGALATAGPDSQDTFRVKTGALPPGIYRHRLIVTTTGAVGHAATLRGLTKSGGVPNAGTDTTLQSTSGLTSPARFNQWYGFGRQEELYYRITGQATTTGDYTATLDTLAVTPVPISYSFAVGDLTISTVGQTGATQIDTDLWVYDSNFVPIPGFGNDDEPAPGITRGSKLTRTFAAGTYYLAISNYNICNDLGSPADDSNNQGAVMDFANGMINSSLSAPVNVSFLITDSATGSVLTAATKAGSYDVLWYQFTVGGQNPQPCYANCDASTNAPILNVNDFQCFLNRFAAGESYANCDSSTAEPVLNVNDFQCFLNAFAVGCT